jgi:hypothetical protein
MYGNARRGRGTNVVRLEDAGLPDCRTAGLPDCRTAGLPDCRTAGLNYNVFNNLIHAVITRYANNIAYLTPFVKSQAIRDSWIRRPSTQRRGRAGRPCPPRRRSAF